VQVSHVCVCVCVCVCGAQVSQVKQRHDRLQVILGEEIKWIHDQRIKVRDNTINGDCKQIILIGLGSEDYKGLASMVQGDYLKSALIKFGRPVFIRRGGTAMWFVKDCEGGSQAVSKETGDEGEWWIGCQMHIGRGANVMLGLPALGVLRVRDSAHILDKISRTWRVFRPYDTFMTHTCTRTRMLTHTKP